MDQTRKIKIGVLALQGAFHLHKKHVEALGAEYVEVIELKDFKSIDALILPGGESGVMLKLMESVGITSGLVHFLKSKPAWGICAGTILMARSVCNPSQKSLNAMDFEIERNAYGRQLESIEEEIEGYRVSYIRAPKIINVGASVKVKACRENAPSWIESEKLFVTSFHPETNGDTPSPWHTRLFELVAKS